jgi:DNA-binding Xre family transcriptional regulator
MKNNITNKNKDDVNITEINNKTINNNFNCEKKIVLVFGDYIEKKNITPYRINKDTKITPLTISNFQKGKLKQLDIETLERLLNYLNCNLEDLIKVVEVK